MYINATDLKKNLGKYLDLAKEQDIYITKNGKNIAKLSNPNIDPKKEFHKLVGIIPNDFDMTLDEIRDERLSKQ